MRYMLKNTDKPKLRAKPHYLLFGLFLSSTLSGCYGDIKDYCEALTNCSGGNENDEAACVEMVKGERKATKEVDCEDSFDQFIECVVDNGVCEEDDGYAWLDPGDKCNNVSEAYLDCFDDIY